MQIDHIHLKNYRCFAELKVDFHPQMTVLVAPNGHGKTAILDAVKVALWPFVAGFDLGSTTNDVTGIHIDDVLMEQVKSHEVAWRLPAEIRAAGQLQVRRLVEERVLKDPNPRPAGKGSNITPDFADKSLWQGIRFRESIKKGTKTKDALSPGAFNIHDVARALDINIAILDDRSPDDLPMLGYYGTGRLWAQKKLTALHEKPDNETLSRTFAYRDCLDPASSYKHFAAWFSRIHQSYLQAQIRRFEKGLSPDAHISDGLVAPFKAVQQTIDATLKPRTGWHTLEYSIEHQELVLNHDQHGELKVSQLSDGIRNMLALVGDLAYRCYKLNSHMGEAAPRSTTGIVMIDEVDMHLHPGWQQTVLTDLMAAFPKLQFIVTTHSPQVLSSIDASCIRLLRQEADPNTGKQQTVVKPVTLQTKGVASSDLLAQIMGVDPIPDVPEARMLSMYHALIQQNLQENADGQALKARLEAHFGATHPVILECQHLLRLQAFRQKLPTQEKSA